MLFCLRVRLKHRLTLRAGNRFELVGLETIVVGIVL